jgi:hypothetical protein
MKRPISFRNSPGPCSVTTISTTAPVSDTPPRWPGWPPPSAAGR